MGKAAGTKKEPLAGAVPGLVILLRDGQGVGRHRMGPFHHLVVDEEGIKTGSVDLVSLTPWGKWRPWDSSFGYPSFEVAPVLCGQRDDGTLWELR